MPAIVADNKDANVPPITAKKPNFDKFSLCLGSRAPIPPI